MLRTPLGRRGRHRLLLPSLAAALCAGGLHAPGAGADTAVLTPQADAYVSSGAARSNFGTSRELRVDASPTQRSYLKFDVTLPAGAVITGATLRLFTTSGSTGTGFRVNAVADSSWSEAGITFATAPALGASLGSSGGWSTTGYRAVTLPVASVRPGLNALGATTTSTTAKVFHSREATNKPQLVIAFTPPPVPAQCADGLDNDGDGKADAADPGCAGATDDDETDPPPPPPLGTDPVIMAAGDIQRAGSTVNATALLLMAAPPDALLTLGDNQYDSGTLADYNAWYSQSWGVPALKARTYPTAGNHERRSDLMTNYCAYFRSGANGAAAVDPCPGGLPYYSYDRGAWHLIALDSSAGTIDAAQLEWLRSDLAAHPAACTLAYWHHPRYSGGTHGNNTLNDVWVPLMAAGVDVVLVGHDHDYQRFAPMDNAGAIDRVNGIRQFVVGTGGSSHYAVSAVTGQEVINADTYGVLRMTLRPGGYDWQFVPEAGKPFTDAGSDLCH